MVLRHLFWRAVAPSTRRNVRIASADGQLAARPLLTFALVAQTALALTPAPDIRFDLKDLLTADVCAPGEGEEIVVCAKPKDDRRYRLPPLASVAEDAGLPRAETQLFGAVKGSIETEAVNVGGSPSNRIMFRLTTPF